MDVNWRDEDTGRIKNSPYCVETMSEVVLVGEIEIDPAVEITTGIPFWKHLSLGEIDD